MPPPSRSAPRPDVDSALVVFLGPSLPREEAERRVPCRVLPPARQGDLLRALAYHPRAVALVDGVFEAQPSVWHREILAALDAGVAVFGASSMGALRAAELGVHGMVGVGTVYEWVASGRIVDDAEVALLHADAEHGHRPLTVPLVNVRHGAAQAVRAGVLSKREAARLLEAAEATFYQARCWPGLLAALPEPARARWREWAPEHLEDLKRVDAVKCLEVARAFVDGAPPPRPVVRPASSWLRRAQLSHGATALPGGLLLGNDAVLEALEASSEGDTLASRGLQRAVLASLAEGLGIRVDGAQLRALQEEWLGHLGAVARKAGGRRVDTAAEAFARLGMDSAQAARLLRELGLEAALLGLSTHVVPDGPSLREGLASEARLCGAWLEAARAVSRGARTRARAPRPARSRGAGSRSR